MDHLWPQDGQFLSPDEVVARLKREFRVVHVDRESGRDETLAFLEWLRGLQAEGKEPAGEPIADAIQRTETLMDDTFALTIADNEDPGDAVLSTIVVPGERLSFGYYSAANKSAARPLLERAARALRCTIIEE